MKPSMIAVSLLLLVFGSCTNKEQGESAQVYVSASDLNRETGTIQFEFGNSSDAVDMCFPYGDLLENNRAAHIRVFIQSGEEVRLINQGHVQPGVPDAVIPALGRRVVRVPLRANLQGDIPARGCLTFRALYAPCGTLGAPMTELLHAGLDMDRVSILQGAWSIDGDAVADDASCERFFDGRIG